MRALFALLVVVLGVAAAAIYLSAFIVHQTQQAIVLEFGKPKTTITDPGLHWKIPVVQTVDFFDKRILDLDTSPNEVITLGEKRIVVDSFARFRISDPLKFYQAVRTEARARDRLGRVLEGAMRRVLGAATLEDIVRDKRDELMGSISKQVNTESAGLGLEVVDVRIKRADLPEANSEAIYKRMQTERQQEAAEFRAEGAAAANRIKATADKEATVIRAEATKQGDQIRGDGEAERNKVFAEAFGKDADFFAFYRSMQAYEQGLKSGDTRLVISPNSSFFKYFGDPDGKAGSSPRR